MRVSYNGSTKPFQGLGTGSIPVTRSFSMIEKTKKFILPGTTLAISLYLSFLFGLGLVIGYICTNFICKKYNIGTNRKRWLLLNIGEWEVHIHHWVYAALIILTIYWFGYMPNIPNIFLGLLLGLIVHDLHTDKIWYKVVYKK